MDTVNCAMCKWFLYSGAHTGYGWVHIHLTQLRGNYRLMNVTGICLPMQHLKQVALQETV